MTTLAVNTALVANTYLDCRTFAKGRQICLAGGPAGTSYTCYGSSDGTVVGVFLGTMNTDPNGNGVIPLPDDCSPFIKYTAPAGKATGTLWVAGQNGAAAVVATGTEVSEIAIGLTTTDMTSLAPGRQIYVTGGIDGDVYTFYAARANSGQVAIIGKQTINQFTDLAGNVNRSLFIDLPHDSSLFVKYANVSGLAPTAVAMRGPLFPAA